MSVDLKDRSDEDSGIYPDWYKPDEDSLEDSFNAPVATDNDLPEGHPSKTSKTESSTASPADLAAAESSGATQEAGAADKSEQAATKNIIGNGFTDESSTNTKRRFRITKKQGITGGIVGLLVSGGIGGLSVVQGPFQLIQMSKLLSVNFFSRNDETNDSSVRRLYNLATGQNEKNNLAPLASALATRNLERMRTVGIDPVFETADGKGRSKIQSLNIDPDTDEGKRLLGRAMSEGFEPPNIQPGEKINISLRGRENAGLARSLVDEMIDIDGKKGLTAKIAARRLKRLFRVNFHPRNVARQEGESIVDRLRRRQNETGQEIREGAETGTTGDAVGSPDEEGNAGPVDEDLDVGDEIADRVDDVTGAPDLVERRTRLQALKSNPFVRGAGAAAAVVGVLCSVKDMGNGVQQYRMANIIKPLIRLAMNFVTTGSQVQSLKDVNFEELRGPAEQLYDESTNTSAFGAMNLKSAVGEEGGTDLNPATKSQITDAYSGNKPQLFSTIDDIPLLSQACSASNWFGDLPVLRQIGSVSEQVLGGLSSVATGRSMDEWMGDLIAVISGDAIDVLAEGAQLGGQLGYGSLLSANASAISQGAAALSPEQALEWKTYLAERRSEEIKTMSIAERYFDPMSVDSFVGIALRESSPYTQGLDSVNYVASGSLSFMGRGLFGPLTKTISARASAQTVHGYEYGIPEYGVPLSQLNSERYENLYENIDRLEDNDFERLRAANAAWGQCFGNPIDDTGRIVDNEATDEEYEHLDDCNDVRGSQEFQDYQMYIQDNVTIKSLACYEGISETSCGEIGTTNTTPTSPSTGAGGTGTPGEDTSSQVCPTDPLITDGGIAEKYGPGRILSHRIRLCIINGDPGMDVNVSIAQNMANMVRAAQQAGVQLTPVSSAYRTFDVQVSLRGSNGCPDTYYASASSCRIPTARPGESNHEEGLAIDFSGIGKCPSRQGIRCVAPGNTKWDWLDANARNFGLNPLRSEAWHWSVTGG